MPPPPTQECLDEFDIFRCINFVRSAVAKGDDPLPGLLRGDTSAWRGVDDYMMPAMEDDGMLLHDYEDVVDAWQA
eukprot:360799-Chlamydomonas_euryale.AAC.5